jgi:hypothetical protein
MRVWRALNSPYGLPHPSHALSGTGRARTHLVLKEQNCWLMTCQITSSHCIFAGSRGTQLFRPCALDQKGAVHPDAAAALSERSRQRDLLRLPGMLLPFFTCSLLPKVDGLIRKSHQTSPSRNW